MMNVWENRDEFATLAALPDAELEWLPGAVLIAQGFSPAASLQDCQTQLDELAQALAPQVLEPSETEPSAERLAEHLYGALQFQGDTHDYYDVRNSCIDQVLERRTGIPITLALVFTEVARRLGLEAVGINFPGHFLVRANGWGGPLFDPFSGKKLELNDILGLLKQMRGMATTLTPEHLRPASIREVLRRMLNNLKSSSLSRNEYENALFCVDRMLLLYPDSPMDWRERGYLYYRLECFSEAAEDIGRFLDAMPEHVTAPSFQKLLDWLQSQPHRLN